MTTRRELIEIEEMAAAHEEMVAKQADTIEEHKRARATLSTLVAEQADTIKALRAGEESLDGLASGALLTPGQLLTRLHLAPESIRIEMLSALLAQARDGIECWDLRHKRRIDELKAESTKTTLLRVLLDKLAAPEQGDANVRYVCSLVRDVLDGKPVDLLGDLNALQEG